MTRKKFNIINLLETNNMVIFINRIYICKEIFSERTDRWRKYLGFSVAKEKVHMKKSLREM